MKTLREFDYDLWATEENGKKKYFARVKATGEEAEIELDVMRLLLREEKRMRRERAQRQENTVLRLDYISSGHQEESAWLIDPFDVAEDTQTKILEGELRRALTLQQLDLYKKCIIGDMTLREYAHQNRIDFKVAWRRRELIQKKAKKIFGQGPSNAPKMSIVK